MTTLADALRHAVSCLQMQDQPRLDAEVLLAHVLNKSRSYLHAWPESELTRQQESEFLELVRQRAQGQPVAYLTGHREFWSLDFQVTRDTLIPRPETELLVERTLALVSDGGTMRVADFGSGSGAVAVSLAHERRHWQLYAVDRSFNSLQVARRNAQRLGTGNVSFINASWCETFADQSLNAVVSNPPYVAELDPHLQQGDLRFEPTGALVSGVEGLDDLRILIADAPRILRPGGTILLEHAPEQTRQIHNLLKRNGFMDLQTTRDLAQLERVTSARKPL